MLEEGTAADVTLVARPSSTSNEGDERNPEMHKTKNGNEWHFGMKTHIGADADAGLEYTLVVTAANANDVAQARVLVCLDEREVLGDAGYQGAQKHEEMQNGKANRHIVMRPGKRSRLEKGLAAGEAVR